MPITRVLTFLASVILLVALTSGVVSAAPTNAKKGEIIEITCDNGQSYTIAVNGSGDFSPGHIIAGGWGTLIPVSVEVTGTLNGEEVFHDIATKPGKLKGLSGDLFSCSFADSFTDPETGDVSTFALTAVVFLAPRH